MLSFQVAWTWWKWHFPKMGPGTCECEMHTRYIWWWDQRWMIDITVISGRMISILQHYVTLGYLNQLTHESQPDLWMDWLVLGKQEFQPSGKWKHCLLWDCCVLDCQCLASDQPIYDPAVIPEGWYCQQPGSCGQDPGSCSVSCVWWSLNLTPRSRFGK